MARPSTLSDVEAARLLREYLRSCVREEIDQALDEKLPLYLADRPLAAAGERRPPKAATSGPTTITPDYLSRQQVAAVTGYSLRTITRLIDAGKLRACGPRRDRITRYEVDRFMSQAQPREVTGVETDDIEAEIDRLHDDEK